MRPNLYEIHAREALSMPENWFVHSFQTLGDTREHMMFTGMIAPLKTRGKNAGNPDWNNGDRTTEKQFVVSMKDHKAWVSQWEAKTGNCSECVGSGDVFVSWNVKHGSTYSPCHKCHGTGKLATHNP